MGQCGAAMAWQPGSVQVQQNLACCSGSHAHVTHMQLQRGCTAGAIMVPSIIAADCRIIPSAPTQDVQSSTAPPLTGGCQQLDDCIEVICTLILCLGSQAAAQGTESHNNTMNAPYPDPQAPDTASLLFLCVQLLLPVSFAGAACTTARMCKLPAGLPAARIHRRGRAGVTLQLCGSYI